ncbi:Isocitrate dehydrogenase [NAD] subunit gamma, mitochondrial, partial [Fragariocoptes setiger]
MLKCLKPIAKYGGRFMVTMLPGDGIGPEMMRHVKTIFKVGGMPVDFEEINLDSMNENIEKVEEAITSIKRNGVAIKGNIETREHSKYFKSRNVELRTRLNLYANVVHIRSQPGVATRHHDLDLVLIRQNTEGEYSSIEHETVTGVVECLKVVTRAKSEQIAHYAFNFAIKHGRKKVTCVHKANIMKLSDGLFLDVARSVAKSYPEIEFEDIIIDNCSMQLVSNPHQFDVLLLPNLYGAVLTNIACGLVGGPGLISGANYGDEYAVFETGSRNTGKTIAGKNIANPIAVFNASADLLQHLKLENYASLMRGAVHKALNESKVHTPDLHGIHTTTDVVNLIIDEIRQQTSV